MRRALLLTSVILLAGAGPAGGAPAWRVAADAACARRDAAEARLEPRDEDDRAQVLRFFRGIAAAQRTLVARLDVVAPPPSARRAYARLLAAERAITPLLDEAVARLAAGATPGQVTARLRARVLAANGRVERAAASLGLPACGE